jgi:hypothetical protein
MNIHPDPRGGFHVGPTRLSRILHPHLPPDLPTLLRQRLPVVQQHLGNALPRYLLGLLCVCVCVCVFECVGEHL